MKGIANNIPHNYLERRCLGFADRGLRPNDFLNSSFYKEMIFDRMLLRSYGEILAICVIDCYYDSYN